MLNSSVVRRRVGVTENGRPVPLVRLKAHVYCVEAGDVAAGVVDRRVVADRIGPAIRNGEKGTPRSPGKPRAETTQQVGGYSILQGVVETRKVGVRTSPRTG